jgi:hypothetical protein
MRLPMSAVMAAMLRIIIPEQPVMPLKFIGLKHGKVQRSSRSKRCVAMDKRDAIKAKNKRRGR